MTYSAAVIADYFLSLTDPDVGDVMTRLYLQKLLYYAQGFHLALYDQPFFPEPLVAWMRGPVVPAVYCTDHATCSASDPLPRSPTFDPTLIDGTTREFLDEIYDVYGQFAAWKLEALIYTEPPWTATPTHGIITHTALRAYFQTLVVSSPEASP